MTQRYYAAANHVQLGNNTVGRDGDRCDIAAAADAVDRRVVDAVVVVMVVVAIACDDGNDTLNTHDFDMGAPVMCPSSFGESLNKPTKP